MLFSAVFYSVTGWLSTLMILLSGMPAIALPSLPTDAPLPTTLPGLVSRRIQIDLARRLNVPTSSIRIESAIAQTWRDQCMELARANERCVGGEMKGWQVQVDSPQQRWVYRSNRIASRLRQEPLPNATPLSSQDFSYTLSQTLLETVSSQVQQPIENLQILEVRAALWNGCLGVAVPDAVCTEEAIPGFQVIVNDGPKGEIGTLQRDTWPDTRELQREWVYHLNADASQIVYNAAASDHKGMVRTLFTSANQLSTELEPSIIFQSNTAGSGTFTTISLARDGKVTFAQYPTYAVEGQAEEQTFHDIILQASPEDIATFETILEQQQFSNFDQMAYGNDNPFMAIDGGVMFITADASVSISAGSDDIPDQLQTILNAWLWISQGVPLTQ